MIKTVAKFVALLLPVFFIIGVLRRYFGQENFLPDAETISREFSRFPSIRDEIFGLNRLSNQLGSDGSDYFYRIGECWNNVKDVASFFNALGNTFKLGALGVVNVVGGLFVLIALPFVVISYPLQAIAWFGGIVGFSA